MTAFLPLLITALIFCGALVIVMSAAAFFTRRLEILCDRLDFSPGILSILGALGANIPNYVASIDAIARHELDVGLGIIIGSNIYNVAIILGLATFATPNSTGIALRLKERQDARVVGLYALAILLLITALCWLLPGSPLMPVARAGLIGLLLPLLVSLASLVLFAGYIAHIVRRVHPAHSAPERIELAAKKASSPSSFFRLGAEIILALLIALGGVVVMVQSGQDLTGDLHMSPVLAGLLVLAVATSLPNTVVAFILARTERAAACFEEIFSSNALNAALGIALPLLFWRDLLADRLLLLLDAPLMVVLTLGMLLCVIAGRAGRAAGVIFLCSYAAWVAIHLLA